MWRYYCFRTADLTLSFLPVHVGYFVARLVADVIYLLAVRSRKRVSANMRHVLGTGADKGRLRRAVRAIFRNTAKNYFDLIRLPRLTVDDLKKGVTIDGWHHLEKALSKRKGVILATAHLGSFDLAAQALVARSVKLAALVEPLQPAPLFRHVTNLRESKGLTCFPVGFGALKRSMLSLRRGEVVVILCDRNVTGKGLKVKFFGEETTLPVGAIALALRTGAAMIPAFSVRQTNNQLGLYIEPPLSLVSTGSHRVCVRTNLEKLIVIIEKYIRRYPEQWTTLEPVWGQPRSR